MTATPRDELVDCLATAHLTWWKRKTGRSLAPLDTDDHEYFTTLAAEARAFFRERMPKVSDLRNASVHFDADRMLALVRERLGL